MPDLDLPRTEDGVCPVVVAIISRRQTGKSTLAAAVAPQLAVPERTVTVSPVGVMKTKLPEIPWIELHAQEKDRVERTFREFMDGRHVFVIADEFDELCGERSYVAPAVYDYVNYAGNYGTGLLVCARGTADITKNLLQNIDLAFIGATNEPNALRYLKELLHDPTAVDPATGEPINFAEILKVLPKYVFLLWVPGASGKKFQGYWIVEDGRIREWDPKELEKQGPKTEEIPAGPSGEAAGAETTSGAPSPARNASAVGSPSPTGPGRPTAVPATSSPNANG